MTECTKNYAPGYESVLLSREVILMPLLKVSAWPDSRLTDFMK